MRELGTGNGRDVWRDFGLLNRLGFTGWQCCGSVAAATSKSPRVSELALLYVVRAYCLYRRRLLVVEEDRRGYRGDICAGKDAVSFDRSPSRQR